MAIGRIARPSTGTLRKHAHHLIGFQKPSRLPEERRLPSLISLEWKGTHQRNCLLP